MEQTETVSKFLNYDNSTTLAKSKVITKEMFRNRLKVFNPKYNDIEIAYMFNKTNTNGDDTIDENELGNFQFRGKKFRSQTLV